MKKYFVAATAALLAQSFLLGSIATPAVAGQKAKQSVDLSDPFKAGLHFMNKNDYVSAVGYFQKAVAGNYKDCAIVHYYLANALWKRGRKDDALISYAKSYLLDPSGQTAAHSVRVLRHYSGRVKTLASQRELTPKVRKVVRAAGINEKELEKKAKSRGPAKTNGSMIDKKQLATVQSRMPKLNKFTPGKPTAQTFFSWIPRAQADFLPQAEARMESAKASLRQSIGVFERAKFEASRILPKHRNHGESEADFKARSKQQTDKYNEIMRPFRQDVSDRTTYANESISMRNRAWTMWGQERDIPYLQVPAAAQKPKG